MAKILIAAGAEKVAFTNAPGCTAPGEAVNHKDRELIELLLANGANPDEEDEGTEKHNTMLHVVVRAGDEPLARLFIAYGANVNAGERKRDYAFILCRFGRK